MSGLQIKKCIDDFQMLVVLGRGSYGKVFLVKEKSTGSIFALKIIKKKYIEKRRQHKNVITERNILANIKHPFIIKLAFAFHDDINLYFVQEYAPGGELFQLLQCKNKFTEDQTRFYSAQILLALEKLHSENIIYRDLKPENVLIDMLGYIRLADFGLSKDNVRNKDDALTICGTPEYIAPEILTREGYGKDVDWWMFGGIIYEMITGIPPFTSGLSNIDDKAEGGGHINQNYQLFNLIQHHEIQIPEHITYCCKDLLNKLLQKNPKCRLGYNGATEIKNHPWFESVKWNALLRKEYKAPFVPVIQAYDDVTNFNKQITDLPIIENKQQGYNKEELSELVHSNSNYNNFSYIDQSLLSNQKLNCQEVENDLEIAQETLYININQKQMDKTATHSIPIFYHLTKQKGYPAAL